MDKWRKARAFAPFCLNYVCSPLSATGETPVPRGGLHRQTLFGWGLARTFTGRRRTMKTGHSSVYSMRWAPFRQGAGVRMLLVVAASAATAMGDNAKQDSQKAQATPPQRQMLFTIFKPIMHDMGSCRVLKATVISGPAEIKMVNNRMPGKLSVHDYDGRLGCSLLVIRNRRPLSSTDLRMVRRFAIVAISSVSSAHWARSTTHVRYERSPERSPTIYPAARGDRARTIALSTTQKRCRRPALASSLRTLPPHSKSTSPSFSLPLTT